MGDNSYMKKTLLTKANEWSRKHVSVVTIAAAAGTVMAAVGTIALCYVTWRNVNLTSEELKDQKQQFRYVNRAKIGHGKLITGDSVREARIFLENIGDLPANDFELIWEIFDLNSKNKPNPNKEHIEREEIVFPDQRIEVKCESAFEETNRSIILNVEYQYRCKDLKYIRKKGFYALWLIPSEGKFWVTPAPIINPDHMKVIVETRERLRQFLEKEN